MISTSINANTYIEIININLKILELDLKIYTWLLNLFLKYLKYN